MRAIGRFILCARLHRGIARVIVFLIGMLVQANVANAGCAIQDALTLKAMVSQARQSEE